MNKLRQLASVLSIAYVAVLGFAAAHPGSLNWAIGALDTKW